MFSPISTFFRRRIVSQGSKVGCQQLGMDTQQVEAKVVVLGETNVGKTCMVFRFVEGKFVPHGASTIGASFMVKKLNVDGAKVTMQIWDTAGQERFRSMAPMYYRGASAAVLVVDVTNPDSFGKVRSWVDELKKNAAEDIIMVIACNKCDLVQDRVVKHEDVASYAKGIGAASFETSAATNRGIEELFSHVAKGLVERHRERAASKRSEEGDSSGRGGRVKGSVRVGGKEEGGAGGRAQGGAGGKSKCC